MWNSQKVNETRSNPKGIAGIPIVEHGGGRKEWRRSLAMAGILQLSIDGVKTPIGVLLLVSDKDGRLLALDWTDYEERMVRLLRLHYGMHGYELVPAHNS
jgi:hypothetical protein